MKRGGAETAGTGRIARFDLPRPHKMRGAAFAEPDRHGELREHAFRQMILSIPPGRVSTYGKVAAAAGYPRYHRAVARLLRTGTLDGLPWHRVLGACGEVKLQDEGAREQRARLRAEGVIFAGKRVDMDRYEHTLRPWEAWE